MKEGRTEWRNRNTVGPHVMWFPRHKHHFLCFDNCKESVELCNYTCNINFPGQCVGVCGLERSDVLAGSREVSEVGNGR